MFKKLVLFLFLLSNVAYAATIETTIWTKDNIYGFGDGTRVSLYEKYECNIENAIDDINTTQTTIVVDCGAIISDSINLTVPKTLELDFTYGGSIDGVIGGSTETLKINGPIEGTGQIFGSNLTVDLTGSSTRYAYPEWWGIDGTADEAEIQLAGNAIGSGGTVQLTDGKTYNCAAPLTFTGLSNFMIKGNAILDFSSLGTGLTALTVQGAESGTSTTATGTISKTDTSLTVLNETGFTANKMVVITSDEDFSGVESSFKKGELVNIVSTTENTININAGVKDDYSITGKTVTLTEVNQVENITLEDFKITGGGFASEHTGIIVKYAKNVLSERIKMVDVEDNGIVYNYVDNGTINNCTVINTDGGGAVPGYVYQFGFLTQNSKVINSHAENLIHGFTTASNYPVRDCVVDGNTFTKSAGNFSALHTHNNGTNIVFSDNIIRDVYIGVGMFGPGNTIVNNKVFNAAFAAIFLLEDGLRKTLVDANYAEGLRGVVTNAYDGSEVEQVDIRNNKFIGVGLGGSILHGITVSTDNTVIANNTIINHSPGIRVINADYVNVDYNKIINVQDDTSLIGIWFNTTGSNSGCVAKDNTIIHDGATTAHQYGFTVASGMTDTIIENNIINDYTVAPLNDSGTRTKFRGNILNGDSQKYRILGVTGAGVGDGSTNGKARTTATVNYEINGKKFSKASTDDLFDLTGVTTSASEYKKVLLCLNIVGAGSIIEGVAGVSQEAAKIPDWWPYNVTPVGIVEIPNSFSGGDLAAFTFYDLIGQIE